MLFSGKFGERNGRALSRSPAEIYHYLVVGRNILQGGTLR